jgi:hypothetical protein
MNTKTLNKDNWNRIKNKNKDIQAKELFVYKTEFPRRLSLSKFGQILDNQRSYLVKTFLNKKKKKKLNACLRSKINVKNLTRPFTTELLKC